MGKIVQKNKDSKGWIVYNRNQDQGEEARKPKTEMRGNREKEIGERERLGGWSTGWELGGKLRVEKAS